ncbi:restriction endonuclease subunit S, partial [Elizabethkingia miricola]
MSLVHRVEDLFKDKKYPERWQITTLNTVATIQNGYAFKSALFNSAEGFPLLRIRDILESKIETYYSGDFSKEYIVNFDDLIIGMDGDFNHTLWRNKPTLLNQRVCRIKPNENFILKKFIFYGIGGFLKIINENTSSTTVKHLSSKSVNEIPFPLPPLPEQERIVAKLDALFAQHEAMKKALERIPQLLKDFRQQVLEQAVTGILTESWRINKNLENISEFSKFYSNKRKEDFTKLSEEAKKKKLSKPRIYANLENIKILEHERINTKKANNWIIKPISWISSSEESSIVDGPFGSSINVEKDYVEIGVPVIRMINIR